MLQSRTLGWPFGGSLVTESRESRRMPPRRRQVAAAGVAAAAKGVDRERVHYCLYVLVNKHFVNVHRPGALHSFSTRWRHTLGHQPPQLRLQLRNLCVPILYFVAQIHFVTTRGTF
jgi:hypothetical protein